jgi:hypothetical protein
MTVKPFSSAPATRLILVSPRPNMAKKPRNRLPKSGEGEAVKEMKGGGSRASSILAVGAVVVVP